MTSGRRFYRACFPGAVGLRFGAKNFFVSKADQGIELGAGLMKNAAAVTAVAPARPASGHVFSTAKGNSAVSALAGLNIDGDIIYKQLPSPAVFHGNVPAS